MTDDYLLGDLERSQLNATRRRRWNRSKRYYQLLLLTLGFVALLVLATPSIISHTGIAHSLLATNAQAYRWEASAESIHVGWITPLSIKGLRLNGPSGETSLAIERADTALTVTSLLRFDPSTIGEVSLRGVAMECTVADGKTSVEDDLSAFFEQDESADSTVAASIQIQDVQATVTEKTTGAAWVLSQSNVNVVVDGEAISGEVTGVVNEPSGSGGAIQSEFLYQLALHTTDESGETLPRWELSIDTDSFPLSVTDLVAKRFAGSIEGLPQHYSGDTTGRIQLVGGDDGAISASLGDVRIRNMTATRLEKGNAQNQFAQNQFAQGQIAQGQIAQDQFTPDDSGMNLSQWSNQLATLDGDVALSSGWLRGRGLVVATDFASATIDGAFPTTISLSGSNDNPLRWLQALEGTARVDIDLAMLDRALPGVIPLRNDVTLVSGRAVAVLENRPNGSGPDKSTSRQSHVTISSESLRARAEGRVVVIEPMKVIATVTDENGSLRADLFELESSFAVASGRGTMESGTAEFEVDFGRLYAMLRPIIDMSDLSLGGNAGGEIRWSVKSGDESNLDRWELDGIGEAKNLLVTLPNGYRFKRNLVQGDIAAKGQWDGRRLAMLSGADIAFRSGGISMKASLIEPVSAPHADSIFPLRVESDGRLEYLSESMRMWLPESLRSAEGRLTGSAIVKLGRLGGSLSQADFVVGQPRVNYDNRWFSQPKVTVKFRGTFDWPSGNFVSDETTIEGDALTLAVRGEMSREKTDLDLAWNADLQRVQESIGATIARAASTRLARPISYRAVQPTSYRLTGLSKGRANVSGGASRWTIDTSVSSTDFAVYQPASSQNLPPGSAPGAASGAFGPRATFGKSFGQPGGNQFGEMLWQEPRLNLDAMIHYDAEKGVATFPELQIASDGFVGTMEGDARFEGDSYWVRMSGPSRWKMDIVAMRLATLTGTPMWASGVHEGPVEFRLTSSTSRPVDLDASGSLGWDTFEVAGVRFGKASIPFSADETSVSVSKAKVPLLSLDSAAGKNATGAVGQASFAARFDYASVPSTLVIEPGSSIDSLQVSPSTGAAWLQYLAPLAAQATQLDGTVGVKFDEAVVVVDDPTASRIRGSLDIQGMRLASGPLATQLIQGVEQIQSLARLAGGSFEPTQAKTLIEMPPQSVEFSLDNRMVTHQRMYFRIDRANLMTSGRVGLDSSMNLVALVPLDPRWLGSDLKGLAGQTLTFPITGTLSKPRLDASVVRSVMSDLSTKAGAEVIQNRLDGLIQKQLGSGMDQINSGIEKILGF